MIHEIRTHTLVPGRAAECLRLSGGVGLPARRSAIKVKGMLMSPDQLQEALTYQKANGGKLGSTLTRLGFVKDEEITALLSRQYGVPSINLGQFDIDAVLRIDGNGGIVVENLNVAHKHQKPNPNAGVAGGIVDQELALEPSKVMLFNPTTQKGDRVGFRKLADGRKVRFFKSNGEVVDT